MKASDYCPTCRGKGEVLTDEGYVPCPADTLRAAHLTTGLPGQQSASRISRYGSAKEAKRLRAIHEPEPEVLIGYINEDGSGDGDWYADLSPLEAWNADGNR